MKAKRGEVERALDRPSDAVRLVLLYGPDESGSRALAARLGKAMGDGAERIDLTAGQLKSDPAQLADEAASISLFGGARYIRIEPATDEATEAVSGLLEAATAGNPVVAVAGALRADSKLVKLVVAASNALALASYPPEAGDFDRLAMEAARAAGLETTPDCARRLAVAAGGDRMVLAQEIEKLSLYLDAAPDRRRPVTPDVLDALLADASEGSLATLVDAALEGRADAAAAELTRLAADGVTGIPLLVAVEKRLILLSGLRAQVENGNAVARVIEGAGRQIFFRDKDPITRQLSRWTGTALAQAMGRLLAARRAATRASGAGLIGVEQELLALARFAARLRR